MHVTASLTDVVAMGTAPPRLEIELQTIQFFPYHAGLAMPCCTRLRTLIALAAGSCSRRLSTLGELLTQERSSSSSWLCQGCNIVRRGAPSRLVGHPVVRHGDTSERDVGIQLISFANFISRSPCEEGCNERAQ